MYVVAYTAPMKKTKTRKISKNIEVRYISATDARKDFFNMIDRVKDSPSTVTISVKGKPEVVIMDKDEYDGWLETIDVLADEDLMRQIRQGEKDIKAGKFHDWEDVKKELKLDD